MTKNLPTCACSSLCVFSVILCQRLLPTKHPLHFVRLPLNTPLPSTPLQVRLARFEVPDSSSSVQPSLWQTPRHTQDNVASRLDGSRRAGALCARAERERTVLNKKKRTRDGMLTLPSIFTRSLTVVKVSAMCTFTSPDTEGRSHPVSNASPSFFYE